MPASTSACARSTRFQPEFPSTRKTMEGKMHTTTLTRIKAITVSTAALSLGLLLGGCFPTTPSAPAGFDLTQRLVFPQTAQTVTMDGEAAEAAWGDGFNFELEQG